MLHVSLFYEASENYVVIVFVVIYSKMRLFEDGHVVMLTRMGNSDIDRIA